MKTHESRPCPPADAEALASTARPRSSFPRSGGSLEVDESIEFSRSLRIFGRERAIKLLPSGDAVAIETTDEGKPTSQILVTRGERTKIVRAGIAATRDRHGVGRARVGVWEYRNTAVAVWCDYTSAGPILSFGRVVGERPVGVTRLSAAEVDALEKAIERMEGKKSP